MADPTEIRPGAVIRTEGKMCKVLTWRVHSGGGKMGSMIHARLRDLGTGNTIEARFETKDSVEELDVERRKMQYLYAEGDKLTFMDNENFEQLELHKDVVGPVADFLKENDEIQIETFEGKAVGIRFKDKVTLKVVSTGAPIKDKSSSADKDATLENGMTIKVPQFIKEGDRVRVSVDTGDYLDRVKDSNY